MLKKDLIRLYNFKIDEVPESKLGLRYVIFINFIISKSFRSIYFYRLANSGSYIKRNGYITTFLLIMSRLFQCLDIPFSAEIGGGVLMGHPTGIVLHPKCIIGNNVTIMQNVTIGGNTGKKKRGRSSPIIGDNVLIGPGANILGPIIIGDNSIVGANAVVIKDVPKDSVVVGVPAKVIKKVKEPFIEIERKNKPK